jgi:hypothetical protein
MLLQALHISKAFNSRQVLLEPSTCYAQPGLWQSSTNAGQRSRILTASVKMLARTVEMLARTVEMLARTAEMPARTAEMPARTADMPARTAEVLASYSRMPARTTECWLTTLSCHAWLAPASEIGRAEHH